MRILQVCPKFHDSVASGSTIVAYQFSKELVNRGHNVTVYTSDMKDKYTRLKDKIIKIEGINVNRLYSIGTVLTRELKIFVTPEIINKTRKEIISFDIVHLHEYRNLKNVVIHHYAKKYGIPYILETHGNLPRVMPKKMLKWIYDLFFGYRLLRDAKKVIALNQTEAEQYRSMGVTDDKIEIIPNGIDFSDYSDLPSKGDFKKKFKIPENNKIILYLGRIHESKGIDLLVKSFSILVNRLELGETILVIVGPDSGHLEKVKSLASSLGIIDSILFTGFISAEDKRKALVDANVFVTPSFSGFPITFLETCATGTPIITTTLGDNLEWIDGKAGYVTIPTPSALSDAIYKILLDDDLCKKFSENCKSIVKSYFSLDLVIDKLEQLYAQAVNE